MAGSISPRRILAVAKVIERRIRLYQNGFFSWQEAPFADECRVDILVDGRRRASVMASPFQLDYLAVGFLFGENIISEASDIKNLLVQGLEIHVELVHKKLASTSLTMGNIETQPAARPCLSHPALDAAAILSLSEDFNSHSLLFRQTGAVHSCCLITGSKRHHADDVARHNALDKVIGRHILEGPLREPALLLTTGRISTEILIKSAKAGIGAIISRSAATDRAVELAKKLGMVMIGFSRQNRFNVYNGWEKIAGAPAPG